MSPDVLLSEPPEPTVLRRSDLQDLPVIDFTGGGATDRRHSAGEPSTGEPSACGPAELERAFQEGWAAGERTGLASTEAASARIVDALVSAADRIETAGERQRSDTNTLAVELALELAALILRREIATAADPGRDAIVRCLETATATGPVTVRMHPDDLDRFGGTDGLPAANTYTVVADPEVSPGDALVDVGGGRLDGSVSNALARVDEVLRP